MMTRRAPALLQAIAGPSRPSQVRLLTTVPPLLRQQERLPPSNVRARRRLREAATRTSTPSPTSRISTPSQDPQATSLYQTHNIEPYEPSSSASAGIVDIPNDPKGVLQESHAARELLGHESLVIVRQIEMLNVFMGFEQANRYAIHTPQGDLVGFLAEEEQSIVGTMTRQFLRTHRPFKAIVMDKTGKPILWIKRPFQFINSRIYVHSSEEVNGKLVGEAQQEWHPWRRRYNVFQSRQEDTFSQFAKVDSGLWAWDFWLKDKDDRLVASINRNFRGLGRELFTDTGQYVIRFDSAGTELDLPPGSEASLQGQTLVLPKSKDGGLTLDQRAMTLATAVSIDFDYFSRHSGSGGIGFPFMMWGGGGGSEMTSNGQGQAGDVPAGPAADAAAGVMGQGQGGLSEDEEIYGRQPERGIRDEDLPRYGEGDDPGLVEGEEVMQDPWGQSGDDGGLFGESGGASGDGGGDWGDWS